jgi:hypothetical protein
LPHCAQYPFPFYVLPGLDEKPDEEMRGTAYELMARAEAEAEAVKTEMERWDDGIQVQL